MTIRNGAEWIYTTGEKSDSGESYTTGKSISKVTLKDGGIINLRNADVKEKICRYKQRHSTQKQGIRRSSYVR